MKKEIKVVVSCRNSNGQPDFYFTTVSVNENAYNDGTHYDIAEEDARLAGYDVFCSFDEKDPAFKYIKFPKKK